MYTLGNLLALTITAANEPERAQVRELAAQVQAATGGTMEVVYVDQGDTGEAAADQARQSGIALEVVKHHAAKRGFVLLPKRWGVERTFGWLNRFRRLTRDDERLALILRRWHGVAYVGLILARLDSQSA